MSDDMYPEDLCWFCCTVADDHSAWGSEDSLRAEVFHNGFDQSLDELLFGLLRLLRRHSE